MKALISFFNRLMQRYLPDPFLFVIILAFVVFLLGILITDNQSLQDSPSLGRWLLGDLNFNKNGGVFYDFTVF